MHEPEPIVTPPPASDITVTLPSACTMITRNNAASSPVLTEVHRLEAAINLDRLVT